MIELLLGNEIIILIHIGVIFQFLVDPVARYREGYPATILYEFV
jgi:hypothetical protein